LKPSAAHPVHRLPTVLQQPLRAGCPRQAALSFRVGSCSSPEVSIATTNVPESAEVMKKATISIIARKDIIELIGKLPKVTKRALAILSETASPMPAAANISRFKAVPPKTASHIKLKAVGASSAPIINLRMVW